MLGTLYPKLAVSVLPVEPGGLGLPDLAAHLTAMLPSRNGSSSATRRIRSRTCRATRLQPCFLALGRPLGYYQLVTNSDSCRPAAALPYRLQSMPQAIGGFGHRCIMAPASQHHQSVLVELTFHNTPDPAAHPAADPEVVSPAARA